MAARHFRHQSRKQRAEHARQGIDQAGFLGDTQQAEPEGQGAEQQHHDLDRQLGHGKQAFDHGSEHRRVVTEQPARQAGNGRHHEKPQPQPIEHAVSPPRSMGGMIARLSEAGVGG